MVSDKNLDNFYLPNLLYQALITYQKQQGLENTSLALIEILSQFFQKEAEVQHYATIEQLEALEKKVNHLSQQVAQTVEVSASPPQTKADRIVSSVGNNNIIESIDLEEVEDEPDEILYNFIDPRNQT